MRISLEHGPAGTYLLVAETGGTRLVQFDTDYPGVARSFGWQGPEETREAILEAREFLDEHVGAEADDPGYF